MEEKETRRDGFQVGYSCTNVADCECLFMLIMVHLFKKRSRNLTHLVEVNFRLTLVYF